MLWSHRAQLLPWTPASRLGSVVVIVGADLLQRGPSHRMLRNEEGRLDCEDGMPPAEEGT